MTFKNRTRFNALLVSTLIATILSGCQFPPPPWETASDSAEQPTPIQTVEASVSGPLPPMMPQLPSVEFVPTPTPVPNIVEPIANTNTPSGTNTNSGQAPVPLNYYLTQEDQSYPEPPPSWANTENFLILGTDKRANDPVWRTDVIMVVGLDRATGRAALLSIPRDLYVNIPGTNRNRINTVDYMGDRILRVEGGGAKLVSQVIRKQFGIQTNHWVRIHMDGLSDLVDALGGVTVQLECPFFEPILNLDTNEWEYFTLPAGEVVLDGDDARWFVRLRLRESDIGRSRRQRQLLSAIKDQIISTNAFLQFPALWATMSEIYETDLDLGQTMELATFALGLNTENIHSGGISGENGALVNHRTEQGAQVFLIGDEAAVRRTIEDVWNKSVTTEAVEQTCPPIPQAGPGNPYATPQIQQTEPPTDTVETSG